MDNAGKLLDKLLEEAGIDRSKVYVTNIVKVRPTKESGGHTKNRPPRAGELKEGIEVLREYLDLVKPNALILLGSTPAKALIKKSFTLKTERGILFDSELGLPARCNLSPRLPAEAQRRKPRRLRPDKGRGGRGPQRRMGPRSRVP